MALEISNVKQNLIPNDVTLADLLKQAKKDLMLSINCHHLGTIKSFDPVKQTAIVTINYKKTFFNQNPVTKTYEPTLKDYPLTADAPVICLGGGPGALTFPIEPGDECLVLFNDRDMDSWFAGSASSAPSTSRLHSFADAIILVGVRSLAKVLPEYNMDAAELRYGKNKIEISGDYFKATLESGVSLEINSEGKLSITNTTGEFVSALIQFFQTATAGGFPIVGDLSVLQSFMATPGP